ncbi:hemerythrin [Flexivirga endophytica]|uniref:Hemerythrin n=1 Tax=Flexivirga endophytica TaxID=1849103 RepID=A0A916X1A0_9MICO|nr:hemerythrin domain-containing protein [Flexivirga endophytica]GGB45660.1 hemerythrin [Flexivirga endophytica]GHB66378.1 hemerythrin [Flexivirga endophytica]
MTDPATSMGELATALTREHHEIDSGIEEFVACAESGEVRAEPLLRTMTALRRHIYLEETILFPPLRAAGLMMPVMVMLREHGALWDAMDTLETDLTGTADPSALLEQCRQLLAMLDQHNTKEEPVIYPRADLDLDEAVHDDLADFLYAGRMPEGWTCQNASAT